MTEKQIKKQQKKDRIEGLTNIIKFVPPSWITEKLYKDHKTFFDSCKNTIRTRFQDHICAMLNFSEVPNENPHWHYIDVNNVSSRKIVNLWREGRIISPPTTGQDPKIYSSTNVSIASKHFGNMWGDEYGSFWLREAVFNFVMYPNGITVLETTDIEHRLWGIIGGALGYIPLKSNKKLFFKSIKIHKKNEDGSISDAIEVNDLYIHEIVEKANEYTSEDNRVTLDDVLNRYYSQNIRVRLLPMFTTEECRYFFSELNDSDSKTIPQMLHAATYESTNWINEFSSPKYFNFTPGNYVPDPLFTLCGEKDLNKLEPLMISYMIAQYVRKNDFVPSSDYKISSKVHDEHGYDNIWNSNDGNNLRQDIKNRLGVLYKFYSNIKNPKITRQICQHLLKTFQWFEEHNFAVCDWELFSNSMSNWIDSNRTFHSGLNKGTRTKFGDKLGSSSVKEYRWVFDLIRNDFLIENLIRNDNGLSIGICRKPQSIPKQFPPDVINISYNRHNGIDIDGKPIGEKMEGGHIISEMELSRMTDAERNEAFREEFSKIFKNELIPETFDFNSNCRTMSFRHNRRMGVLRLSKYLEVMDSDDDTVKQTVKEKYDSLLSKPELV